MSGILIYAELSRNKQPLDVVFELANKANELSKKLDNCEVNAFIISDEVSQIEDLKKSNLDKIYFAKDSRLKDYNTDYYTKVALDIIKIQNPEIVLIGATCQGRDLAPRISATLHAGLTADCTDLDITVDKKLAATRPTFSGKLMATILSKSIPQMATVRAGMFKRNDSDGYKDTIIEDIIPDINSIEKRVDLLEYLQVLKDETNIETSQIIFAGGKGLKTKENFEQLKELAKNMNATVAVTRGLVDLGWAPNSIQVGQTGKNVSPEIYIAFGISGAVQHTVGMINSKHVIAINNDRNAPIFDIADFGIVADASEIIKMLNEKIKG